MSSVIIGVIGVILFIGLAIAGASHLGPRFTSASRDAKTTALVSAVQQVSQGLEMYRLKTGTDFPAGTAINGNASLTPRFLKTAYVNPEGGGTPLVRVYAGRRFVVVGALTADMCRFIQRRVTGSESYGTIGASTAPTGTNGCADEGGNLVVYVAL